MEFQAHRVEGTHDYECVAAERLLNQEDDQDCSEKEAVWYDDGQFMSWTCPAGYALTKMDLSEKRPLPKCCIIK